LGLGIALVAIGMFVAYAISKSMQVQKNWALFAGSLGYKSSQVGVVQGKFEGLFSTVAQGTAHSTEDILIAGQIMAALGFTTQGIGKDMNT
jgi:hypothetical protein